MRFHPIKAFKDPVTRPRAILWLGVALIAFVVLWAVGIDGTSTYWFCTVPCHVVHADNTAAYDQSTHTNVACVACHEPVNASPLVMTMKKIEVLPDLPATIFGWYELPPNHDNHVAEEMPAEQCTQCHDLEHRTITPKGTVVINHDIHSQNKIQCTICHNRVAHPEDGLTFTLEGNRPHDDWMTMDACYRCHSLQPDAAAPGTCPSCHLEGFDPVPATHKKDGWYKKFGESSGHAKAAVEESESIAASIKQLEDHPADEPSHGEVEGKEPTGELTPSSQVNTCYTCHLDTFCSDCHGVEMPHPADFKSNHAKAGYENPAVCAQCHARSAAEAKGTGFCNACHHPQSKPGQAWVSNHRNAVYEDGPEPCFQCHDELDCSGCHVRGITAGRASMQKRFEAEEK